MAELLRRKAAEYGHPIYLISDEPYRESSSRGFSVPWLPDFYDDTLVCYSYSKSLSLPGERIGYILIGTPVVHRESPVCRHLRRGPGAGLRQRPQPLPAGGRRVRRTHRRPHRLPDPIRISSITASPSWATPAWSQRHNLLMVKSPGRRRRLL